MTFREPLRSERTTRLGVRFFPPLNVTSAIGWFPVSDPDETAPESATVTVREVVADAAAARKTAESLGMKIHSVLFGWGNLNGGDAALAEGVAQMETALKTAQAYGADAVLYVPCKIGGMPMPEAWEFDIRFDEKTGHLKQVVAGDNAKYEKYIEAHNQAVDATRIGVQKLIPTAEKTGVLIALENVWNNLWVSVLLLTYS